MNERYLTLNLWQGEEGMTRLAKVHPRYTPGQTNIVAACLLSCRFQAFVVVDQKPPFFLSQARRYELWVTLTDPTTGRQVGRKGFPTAAEAIDYGTKLMREWFPLVEQLKSTTDGNQLELFDKKDS